MKTLILITSMMALGLMGVGCSKSNPNNNGNGTNTPQTTGGPAPILVDPIAPGGTGDPTLFSAGNTVDFKPVDLQTLNTYAMIPGNFAAINNPQNIKINLNLAQSEGGRYGGAITISYVDNGVQHSGVFRAGMGKNQTFKNMYDNGKLEADYNYWFNWEDELSFTGFFEDTFGAITVTLTPEASTGGGNDAEPFNVRYKGSIYFKNFNVEKTTPYRSCWFIYTGSIDCRSNVIQTKCGLAPGPETGYKLLGTFEAVDVKKAFNMN